jgi:hypothetical protein
MHDHHRCVCEHERVRFCRTCRTVYCEGCKQEWVARPFYPWPLSSWPYIQQYGGYSLSTLTANQPGAVQSPIAIKSTTVCGHTSQEGEAP